MRLIVGLGNPGKQYQKTRHNVGFMVIDAIASNFQFPIFNFQLKFNTKISQGIINGRKIILAEPQTFMNLSGEAVKKIMNYYKIGSDDLTVVCDDIDLPLGTIRVRLEGSSGGHQGLQSIIDTIKDDRFVRLRIGIGNNAKIAAEEYVLGRFSKSETTILDKAIDQTVDLLLKYLQEAIKEETVKIR